MIGLLDYQTSPLNPGLKLLVFLIFLAVAFIYYDIRKKFGGEMGVVITSLFLFALCMTAGSLLRFFGHGTVFGFTEEYSLKWFQSLAYLAGAGYLIRAGYRLLQLFRRSGR